MKFGVLVIYGIQTETRVVEYNAHYLFDLILYVPSTIIQLYRGGSSWVEPVLS